MSLMNPQDLLKITDRVGKRYYFTLLAAVSGKADSLSARGENFFEFCHVCPDGDPEIEISTLSQARASDQAWNTDTDEFVLATSLMGGASASYSVLNALTTHLQTATDGSGNLSLTGGWNQYLSEADPTGTIYSSIPTDVTNGTGVRVSEYFRRVFSSVQLQSRNVFYDAPDPFAFATLTGTGSASVTFAELGDFGAGTVATIANGSNFAATQMKLLVSSATWTTGCTIEFEMVTEPNGDTTTIQVVVGAGLTLGDTINIGTDTDRFTKINSATVVAGSTTAAETLSVINKFERVIEL